ncbi:hypothetical protein HY732_00850 [Candidatus Uhrbacteria bacterium]|nr:hypothetical protein [Candidatus Uhrbacteria bacterium]
MTTRADRDPSERILFGIASFPNSRHPDYSDDRSLAEPTIGLFGVFDGVSQFHDKGKAAEKAAQLIAEKFALVDLGLSSNDTAKEMERILQEVHSIIIEGLDKRDCGATTASVVKFCEVSKGGHLVVVGNVGDSRVYKLKKDNGIECLTLDDGILRAEGILGVQEMMKIQDRAGRITSKPKDSNIERFYKYNELSQALGFGDWNAPRRITPRIHQVALETEESLLITSDGIHSNLTTNEIEMYCRSHKNPDKIAHELVTRAYAISKRRRYRSHPDDMTALFIRCGAA